MRAQEAFDELVDGGIWPFLLVRDFKRSKGTFHRRVGENWQVINLQKSAYSDSRQVRFTVNLGVALDRLRSGSFDWAPGRRPSEARCHLGLRLGELLGGRDTWWDVGADTNVVALGESVNLALELFALPWLDARSTDEGVLAIARDPALLREEPLGRANLRWFARLADLHGDHATRRLVEAESARRHAAARLG